LILREEHRLRVIENSLLRKIFGPKGDEVMEGWRKLRNEELRDFYSPPCITGMMKSRRMKWAGHVARMRRGRRRDYWYESRANESNTKEYVDG
jgi:hypothetical protein